MSQYILRALDVQAWAKAKARADREGTTMRAVLLAFIRSYADGAE